MHWIFANFFLEQQFNHKVVYERNCSLLLSQSALRLLFRRDLLRDFCRTCNKLLKRCIAAEFLLIERLVHGALRKELVIAPQLLLQNPLNQLLQESLTERFCQYLQQYTQKLHFCQDFADTRISTKCSIKGAAHCSFRIAL